MPDSEGPLSPETRNALGALLSHFVSQVHAVLDTGTALAVSDARHLAPRFLAERGELLRAVLRVARSFAGPVGGGHPAVAALLRVERASEQLIAATTALAEGAASPPADAATGDDDVVTAIENAYDAVLAAAAELSGRLACEVPSLTALTPARQAYFAAIFPRLRHARAGAPAAPPVGTTA